MDAYIKSQFDRVYGSKSAKFKLKLHSSEGETHWLNLDVEGLFKIFHAVDEAYKRNEGSNYGK